MYKTIGVDGKVYGPFTIEELRKWIAEGRVNAQTQVQQGDSSEWKPASDFPELGFGSGQRPPGLPPLQPLPSAHAGEGEQKGLAITSLVLGVLSLVLGFCTGIPAIICGHIARARVKSSPARYGGGSLALTGLILGYFSVVVTFLILPAMLLPALARAKDRAQRINCTNNMKQIGLAFKTWAIDNKDQYPFNMSVTNGGSFEMCRPDDRGYDLDSGNHFQVMSNELWSPKLLLCPADKGKQAASSFQSLSPENVTYRVHVGKNVDEGHPQEVLAVCPIHKNVLMVDGSVLQMTKKKWEEMERTGVVP